MTRALVPVAGSQQPYSNYEWRTSNGEYGSFYRKRRAREVFRRDVDEPSVTIEEEPVTHDVIITSPSEQVVNGPYKQENELLRRELEDCKLELERLRRAVEEVLGAKNAGGVIVPHSVPQALPIAQPVKEDAAVQTPESVAAALAEAERRAGRLAGHNAVKVNPPFRAGAYRPPPAVRNPVQDAYTPLWRRNRSPEIEQPVTVVPTRPYRPGTGNIGAYKNAPYGRNGVHSGWAAG